MEEIIVILKEKEVISVIIASIIGFAGVSITAFCSVKASIASKERQHRIEIELENRKNKLEIYKKWLDIMKSTFNNNHKNLDDKIKNFFYDSMFYASDDTIRSILDFKIAAYKKENVALQVENILLQLRKELNLSNKNLKKGDLIKIVLKNPEELDKFIK